MDRVGEVKCVCKTVDCDTKESQLRTYNQPTESHGKGQMGLE